VLFALLLLFVTAAPPQSGGAAAVFSSAASALAAGNLPAAEQGFLEVLRLEPNSIPALGNLGVTYARQERFADAVRVYARALKLAPNQPGLLLNLAIAHVKQQDYSAAKPLLLRLPANPQTRQLLATCELFTGQPTRALALLEGLPPTPESLFLSGTALLRLKRPAEARQAFDLLLAQASPAEAHLLLGRAYADNGQLDLAIREFQLALPLPAARLELAKALIAQRDNDNAEQTLRALLAARPNHPEAAYYLGALLVLAARETEALPLLETARAARPDTWGAYYYLGRARLQLNQPALAQPLLEKAAQLNPSESSVWFQLARLYQTMGRAADAQRARARFHQIRESSRESVQAVLPPGQ